MIGGGRLIMKKSQEKIAETLMKLMETNDFSDITVAELCAWSNVSRGTFYNNFTSKEDVISLISQNVVDQYLEQVISCDDNWLKEAATQFFSISKARNDYLLLLSKQNIFYLHSAEVVKSFAAHPKVTNQTLFLQLPENVREYAVLTYCYSAINLFEAWSKKGFPETVEEITEIYLSLVHDPTA